MLSGLLATVAVFAAFPQIDLWVSGQFVAPGGGFPLSENPVVGFLRSLFNLLFGGLCGIVVTMLLLRLRVRQGLRVPVQVWWFVGAVFVLGPGLMANAVLKEYWGRARPADIQEFGGAVQFTPPLLVTDQCQSNCSFVSGEGSAILSAVIVLVVLLWHVWPARRRMLVAAATVVGVTGGFLRIVTGRHFLSDTLFAGLISALIVLVLYRLLDIRKHRRAVDMASLRHDFGELGRYLLASDEKPNARQDVADLWARLCELATRLKRRS